MIVHACVCVCVCACIRVHVCACVCYVTIQCGGVLMCKEAYNLNTTISNACTDPLWFGSTVSVGQDVATVCVFAKQE